MEAADVTLWIALGLMGLTATLVVVDTVLWPDVLNFERQRALTVTSFLVLALAIFLRHCV